MRPHLLVAAGSALVIAAIAPGCIVKAADDDGGGGAGAGATTNAGGGGSGGDPGAGGGGGSPVGSWTVHSHPCPGGSRTDALHRDDDGTLWVGCGTNQVGYGLFFSADGESWSEAVVSPSEKLDQFRVSSISRGHDGALYVAGMNANNGDMVLRIDTGASPFEATAALVAGNQVGQSFHTGTFRSLSDGRALAESLTGHDMLYRPDATIGSNAADWVDTYGWAGGNPATYQILDLAVHADGFYGCGSTIAEPPMLFLPPREAGAEPYELEAIELPNSGWTGEMWGLAVSADRVVVVGVDQQSDVGKIYVSGADRYAPSDYLVHSIPDIIGSQPTGTWGRGACMQGDRVVVVGERQPLGSGTGLVLISDDGGLTFADVTPEGVTESVSKCVVRPDGGVIVAGAGGFVGIYD